MPAWTVLDRDIERWVSVLQHCSSGDQKDMEWLRGMLEAAKPTLPSMARQKDFTRLTQDEAVALVFELEAARTK